MSRGKSFPPGAVLSQLSGSSKFPCFFMVHDTKTGPTFSIIFIKPHRLNEAAGESSSNGRKILRETTQEGDAANSNQHNPDQQGRPGSGKQQVTQAFGIIRDRGSGTNSHPRL